MNEHLSHPAPLLAKKSELRQVMETRRAEAFTKNPEAAFMLCGHFLKEISLKSGCVVASYSARGNEMNPGPLANALRKAGHKIALPVMIGKDKPLLFRLHNLDAPLVKNTFGILEPDAAALVVEPDVLLVPLLAFDRRFHRLGTGGGYYDRTLKKSRSHYAILAIGVGFSCQELPEIPVESHDEPVDRIVTELQAF